MLLNAAAGRRFVTLGVTLCHSCRWKGGLKKEGSLCCSAKTPPSRRRWLSAMVLVEVPWADRVMALPFLTLLAPSKRFYAGKMRAPKTLRESLEQQTATSDVLRVISTCMRYR
jgi:hypothetical protein